MKAIVIWGTQLTLRHHSALRAEPDAPVIMIEARDLCRRYRYHKQKLVFVLAAMRSYRDELRASGRTVWYSSLPSTESWFDELARLCRQHNVDQLVAMRQNDKTPQRRLQDWCKQQHIGLQVTPNTMFLTPTADFDEWAETQKRLHFEMFYRWQRRRLNILMDHNSQPAGGTWNYDAENRQPLSKTIVPPPPAFPKPTNHTVEVKTLVEAEFADHPGQLDDLWLPTTRQQAEAWLQDFLDHRFANFGRYEDAMAKGQSFLYHSAVSALLNVGLLHADEVVQAALNTSNIPLAAKEGFIRQIIGWREFMFGLYHYKPDDWRQTNIFQHQQPLPDWWWQLRNAPEPPLEDVLQRVARYGYAHHIERLMVCGNYMLLAGYQPQQVYDWFMTMFVDAYEWVMVPNVMGMSQFADGGMERGGFATKPYISGSNYLQKMGRWWPTAAAAKESSWTAMYWDFLDNQRQILETNYRLRPLYAKRPRRAREQ